MAVVGDGGGDGEGVGGGCVVGPAATVGRPHLDAVGAGDAVVEALAGGGIGIEVPLDSVEEHPGDEVLGVVERRVSDGPGAVVGAVVDPADLARVDGVVAVDYGGGGGAPLVEGGVGEGNLVADRLEGSLEGGSLAGRDVDVLHSIGRILIRKGKKDATCCRGGRGGTEDQDGGGANARGLGKCAIVHKVQTGRENDGIEVVAVDAVPLDAGDAIGEYQGATAEESVYAILPDGGDLVGVGAVADGVGDDEAVGLAATYRVVAGQLAGGGRGDLEAEGLAAGECGVEGGELGGGSQAQRHGHRDGEQTDKVLFHDVLCFCVLGEY